MRLSQKTDKQLSPRLPLGEERMFHPELWKLESCFYIPNSNNSLSKCAASSSPSNTDSFLCTSLLASCVCVCLKLYSLYRPSCSSEPAATHFFFSSQSWLLGCECLRSSNFHLHSPPVTATWFRKQSQTLACSISTWFLWNLLL